MSNIPLFANLDAKAVETFRYHLWVIYHEDIVESDRDRFNDLLDREGFPRAFKRYSKSELKLSLKGHMEENPFLSLLSTLLEYSDKHENDVKILKGKKLKKAKKRYNNYKRLCFCVLQACLYLKEDEKFYEQTENGYKAPIRAGCRAARLILNEQPKLFKKFGRVTYNLFDVYQKIKNLYETYDVKGSGAGQIYHLYNLFNQFINQSGPINRERESLKNLGLLETSDMEESNYSFYEDSVNLSNTRIPSQELSGDQHKSCTIVDNDELNHEDPIDQVESLQTKENRYYSYSIAKKHMHVSTSVSRIYKHQARKILKLCDERYPEGGQSLLPNTEYLYLALSILFGRTPEFLSSLQRRSASSSETTFWLFKGTGVNQEIYLAYRVDIPSKTSPESKRAIGGDSEEVEANRVEINRRKKMFFNYLKSGLLLLPVPKRWQRALKRALGVDRSELDFSKAFLNIKPSINHTVNLELLPKYLSFELKQKGVDNYHTALLCGRPAFLNAPIYYVQSNPIQSYHYYLNVIEELGVKDIKFDQNIDLLLWDETNRTVGSMVIPKEDAIRELFKSWKRELEQTKPKDLCDYIQYHNIMALYTYLLLALVTGHRPNISPFSSPSIIDARNGFIFIADKKVDCSREGRIVPVVEEAIKQFNSYKRHMYNFKTFLGSIGGNDFLHSLITKHMDVTDLGTPYLFVFAPFDKAYFDELMPYEIPKIYKRTYPISPKRIEDIMFEFFPTQANWTRHYFRTYLTNIKDVKLRISGELIDAALGHGQFGSKPDHPFAGFEYADLTSLKSTITTMLKDLNIQAVRL